MTVLIVDWHAEGGIAEATRAWYNHGRRVGRRCNVVSVVGRSLRGTDVIGVEGRNSPTGYMQHVALVELAEGYIRKYTPEVVLLQGYVMPHEELRVARAANDTGAKLIQVVFTPRPAFFSKGSSIGLSRLLRSADTLVAHTQYVHDRLRPRIRQRTTLTPFPLAADTVGALGAPNEEIMAPGLFARPPRPEPSVVIDSTYCGEPKATALAAAIRTAPVPDGERPWEVTVLSPPRKRVPLALQREWIEPVRHATAALIPEASPYGTELASVALSRGVVPIVPDSAASTEQIGDSRAGILLPADPVEGDWLDALESLRDPEYFGDRMKAGDDLLSDHHADFMAEANELLS